MIESFRVQNYKALRDVEVKLTPMHVLIGPNDSGKTSVLEALGALCRSVDEDLEHAFLGPWSGLDLVWNRSGHPVIFDVCFPFNGSPLTYHLECEFLPSGKKVHVAGEAVHGGAAPRTSDFNSNGTDRTEICRTSAKRTGVVRSPFHMAVEQALSGVQHFRWNPRFLALANAPLSARRFRMDDSGFGLALYLDDILGYDTVTFQKLEQRFSKLFPQIGSIKLVREKGYQQLPEDSIGVPLLQVGMGKGIYFDFPEKNILVPAAQVSDGVLLVLAYLAVLHSPEKPRVLLVEEPENGVHPKRLKDVLRILRELVAEQSHTQVLMTTHSPYVLDEFKPEEVSLCQKGDDGAVQIHRLSDSKTVREQLDVFSLGEIWTAEGDEALARGGSNGAGEKK